MLCVSFVHFCGLNEHRCPIRTIAAQKISKVVLLKYTLGFWHELEGFAESALSSLMKSCPLDHDAHRLHCVPGNEERVYPT